MAITSSSRNRWCLLCAGTGDKIENKKRDKPRASLVAQWLRIRLPVQGTWVPLDKEFPDLWSGKIPHAAEQLSPNATSTEPAL